MVLFKCFNMICVMTRAVRQSCGNNIRILEFCSIDLLLVLVVTFKRVIACFQFQSTILSINKICSYMVPHMLFKYKFQPMFSRESLKGCHLNNVYDFTLPLFEKTSPRVFLALAQSVIVQASVSDSKTGSNSSAPNKIFEYSFFISK